ncbi:MAG: D-cysteine desulfhydrase family protein [Kangiellaceae bacterium]
MSVIKHIPRIKLTHSPTPLEYAPRLSELLGIELWIKRDDCTGLGGGGNKTRKLEFLLADAQSKCADTLVTLGGIQSNHARQTAAAAAKFGFDCELVLQAVEGTPRSNYMNNGNILLDKLFGSKIHTLSDDQDIEEFAQGLMQQLSDHGKLPYLIPIGGSNSIGSLGYVQCVYELLDQLSTDAIECSEEDQNGRVNFDRIILATGSAGTQAGLLAGLIATNDQTEVLGINVSRPSSEQDPLVYQLLKQVMADLNFDPKKVSESMLRARVKTNGDYYGEGYGQVTEAMLEAVKTCAELEGLLLDPVYSGKAMAGLFDLCRKGEIAAGSRVMFLHTGGSVGLFAYQEAF